MGFRFFDKQKMHRWNWFLSTKLFKEGEKLKYDINQILKSQAVV